MQKHFFGASLQVGWQSIDVVTNSLRPAYRVDQARFFVTPESHFIGNRTFVTEKQPTTNDHIDDGYFHLSKIEKLLHQKKVGITVDNDSLTLDRRLRSISSTVIPSRKRDLQASSTRT
jgi:hypothetical protein